MFGKYLTTGSKIHKSVLGTWKHLNMNVKGGLKLLLRYALRKRKFLETPPSSIIHWTKQNMCARERVSLLDSLAFFPVLGKLDRFTSESKMTSPLRSGTAF